MMSRRHTLDCLMVLAMVGVCAGAAAASGDDMQNLLAHTSQQVSALVDQFSEVKCTEQVIQEKFKRDGKTEFKEESSYDYLVILTNAGGELSLDESRLPVHVAPRTKRRICLCWSAMDSPPSSWFSIHTMRIVSSSPISGQKI